MLLWTLGFMYLFELVFLFLSDVYPGVELLGHMILLFLVFIETSILFSTVSAPIYIPMNSVKGNPCILLVKLLLNGLCFLQCMVRKLTGNYSNDSRLLKTTWSSSVEAFQRILCILNVYLALLLANGSKLANWKRTCFCIRLPRKLLELYNQL